MTPTTNMTMMWELAHLSGYLAAKVMGNNTSVRPAVNKVRPRISSCENKAMGSRSKALFLSLLEMTPALEALC